MYFVYILKSQEGKYYVWQTENLEQRLLDHNSKRFIGWTNRYNDWQLIHQEKFESRKDAQIRENEIKSYKGWYKFKSLIWMPLSN